MATFAVGQLGLPNLDPSTLNNPKAPVAQYGWPVATYVPDDNWDYRFRRLVFLTFSTNGTPDWNIARINYRGEDVQCIAGNNRHYKPANECTLAQSLDYFREYQNITKVEVLGAAVFKELTERFGLRMAWDWPTWDMLIRDPQRRANAEARECRLATDDYRVPSFAHRSSSEIEAFMSKVDGIIGTYTGNATPSDDPSLNHSAARAQKLWYLASRLKDELERALRHEQAEQQRDLLDLKAERAQVAEQIRQGREIPEVSNTGACRELLSYDPSRSGDAWAEYLVTSTTPTRQGGQERRERALVGATSQPSIGPLAPPALPAQQQQEQGNNVADPAFQVVTTSGFQVAADLRRSKELLTTLTQEYWHARFERFKQRFHAAGNTGQPENVILATTFGYTHQQALSTGDHRYLMTWAEFLRMVDHSGEPGIMNRHTTRNA